MKKMVASIATGVILAGATMTSVSAADYEVEKGDNLWAIAQDHDTTVNELVDINDLKTTTIQPKQMIAIDETDSNDASSYSVEKGDTLFGISNEFDVTVADLKGWNNLNSNIIQIGQELQVDGAAVDQNQADQTSNTNKGASAQADDSKQESPQQTANSDQTTNNNNQNSTKQNSAKQQNGKQETSSNHKSDNQSQNKPDGKTVSVTATAYTADCAGCSGVTSTGVDLNAHPNKNVIAVDPDVIPLGSEVYVEGYGHATAADTGGAINGNKIDVHVASEGEANSWGVQNVNVTVLD